MGYNLPICSSLFILAKGKNLLDWCRFYTLEGHELVLTSCIIMMAHTLEIARVGPQYTCTYITKHSTSWLLECLTPEGKQGHDSPLYEGWQSKALQTFLQTSTQAARARLNSRLMSSKTA